MLSRFVRTMTVLVLLGACRIAGAEPTGWDELMRGGIVVNQPPLHLGAGAADTEFLNMYGDPSWQLVADDVMLSAPAAVRRVTYWGFYDMNNPPTPETMRIRLYDARPGDGLPGDVVFEESVLNPSRVATGRLIAATVIADEYIYEVDLTTQMDLDANTPYWLEIVQIGDLQTAYRYVKALSNGTDIAFLNPHVPGWQQTPGGDVAFQLSTVPEPESFLVLVFCLVIVRQWAGSWKEASVWQTHRWPGGESVVSLSAFAVGKYQPHH